MATYFILVPFKELRQSSPSLIVPKEVQPKYTQSKLTEYNKKEPFSSRRYNVRSANIHMNCC